MRGLIAVETTATTGGGAGLDHDRGNHRWRRSSKRLVLAGEQSARAVRAPATSHGRVAGRIHWNDVSLSAKTNGMITARGVTPLVALPKLKGNWLSSLASPVVSAALFLGFWEIMARVLEVPIWILPKPSDFIARLFSDRVYILGHTLATSAVILGGFALGLAVAVPLGLAVISVRRLERGLYPIIVFLNIMPKTIIGPILIIWFGIGPLASAFIVFLMCFFPILVDSMTGFRAIDPRLYYITRSMGATGWQTLRYVRVPAAMSYIFAGMKIGMVKAVEGAIVAEFIASNQGLGYMIMRASSFMDMTLIFSGLLAAAFVALAFNGLLLAAERVLMPWGPRHAR